MTSPCLVCGAVRLRALAPGWTRCGRCGFVEGPAAEGIDLHTYLDLHDSGRGARLEHARRGVYAPILRRFAPWGGRRCLDVGSGSGVFARLAAAAGWRCVGVDPAGPEAVEDGIRLVRAPFPPAPAGPFELVTFFNSLNYMTDPVNALAAAREALAPGGRLVIRVPNVDFHLAVRRLVRAAGAASRVGGWLHQGTILHPRSFSARTLRIALARAGFRSVTVEASPPVPGDPYATGAVAIAAAKAVVGALALGLDRVSGHRVLLASTLLATTGDERAARGGC